MARATNLTRHASIAAESLRAWCVRIVTLDNTFETAFHTKVINVSSNVFYVFKLLRSLRYYTFLFGNSHRLYTQRMMKIASDPFRRPSRSKVVGSNETTPIRCCLCLVTFKLGKWYRDWSFVMIVYLSLKLLGPSYRMNVHECVFKLRMRRTRSNIHIAELERDVQFSIADWLSFMLTSRYLPLY